jgi:alginate O-acetyltransferase complex protein AlgI
MPAVMLFHSQIFVFGFLPLCLAGFWIAGRWALHWAIAASLVFYGWWNPVHIPLLVGSILANHAVGRRIRQSPTPRRWLIAGVAGNLVLLGWFKYADFLLGIVAPDTPAFGIVLPLAISFFTFQQIMFLADCRDTGRPAPGLLHYAAFVAFFPHLIAGPLVRPRDIVPQLAALTGARPAAENLSAGLTLFLLGLAKKLVLADMFGGFADTGFDAAARLEALTLLEAWAATLSYALQIYFDFSAYSDMATGLARMFGVRFPLNFDSPYQASDIADFWRRWHITLGSFLRDQVYIPLGGNRSRAAFNLMATMLVAGLWHGAAWRFVLWGGLHGAMLVGHRLYRRIGPPLPRPLGRVITLVLVCLAWVPFRAEGMAAAWAMMRGVVGLNGLAVPAMIVGAFPALNAIATPVPLLRFLGDARTLSLPEVFACLLLGWAIVLAFPHAQALSDRARGWAVTASFAFAIRALCFAPHVAPFLYFQF